MAKLGADLEVAMKLVCAGIILGFYILCLYFEPSKNDAVKSKYTFEEKN